MSAKRLFILDPNLRFVTGHYLAYADSIAAAARARAIACQILGHADIDRQLAASFGVVPVFRSDIWRNTIGEDYFSNANMVAINRDFFEDAVAFLDGCDLSIGDTVFYPTLTSGQLAGIADLVDYFSGRGIRHQILLRYQATFYRGDVAAAGFRRLEAASAQEAIQFSSDSHRLVYELGALTKQPIATYPIPHTNHATGDAAPNTAT